VSWRVVKRDYDANNPKPGQEQISFLIRAKDNAWTDKEHESFEFETLAAAEVIACLVGGEIYIVL
jgi:hypothetical protein